jgi:hypothetical protein
MRIVGGPLFPLLVVASLLYRQAKKHEDNKADTAALRVALETYGGKDKSKKIRMSTANLYGCSDEQLNKAIHEVTARLYDQAGRPHCLSFPHPGCLLVCSVPCAAGLCGCLAVANASI